MKEREFYIKLCIKEKYSARELKRQLDSAYFERYRLSTEKLHELTEVAEIQQLSGKNSDDEIPF